MSAETKADLYRALQAHILDSVDGQIVTDWALVAATTTFDNIGSGVTSYFVEGNENQPVHVTVGLLRYGGEHSTFGDSDDES
jgi:hypothetical protein